MFEDTSRVDESFLLRNKEIICSQSMMSEAYFEQLGKWFKSQLLMPVELSLPVFDISSFRRRFPVCGHSFFGTCLD